MKALILSEFYSICPWHADEMSKNVIGLTSNLQNQNYGHLSEIRILMANSEKNISGEGEILHTS